MAYITAQDFLNSPYGAEFAPTSGSIFKTDNNLDLFLEDISALIDLYCGRSFNVVDYVEEFSGLDSDVFFVNQIPLKKISSIEYEYFGTSGIVLPDCYMINKSGRVKLLDKFGAFSKISYYGLYRDYNYTINYTAGYDVIPEPIRLASLMLANTYAKSIDDGAVGIADGGSVVSFKFGTFAEQYTDPRQKNTGYKEGIPVTVMAILNRYKYLR